MLKALPPPKIELRELQNLLAVKRQQTEVEYEKIEVQQTSILFVFFMLCLSFSIYSPITNIGWAIATTILLLTRNGLYKKCK